MSDLEGMINGILSNPDEMKKIMDMAGKIMGTEGEAATGEIIDTPPASAPNLDSILSGINGIPGGWAQAAEKLLGGSGIQNLLGGAGAQNLVGGATNGKNDKRELFNALKPWLSDKRQYKLEKAIVFARAMRFAGVVALKKGG